MADIPVGKALWSDLIRRIARRTRNRRDAEDLLHSAYLRLARYGGERPVGDPAAFLVRTAFNISIDNYRHEKSCKINRKRRMWKMAPRFRMR